MAWALLLLVGLFQHALAYDIDWKKLEGLTRGKVELNRLKEVKAFVTEDLPLYHNLEMKHIAGADPELVLLDNRYKELDRIPLSEMKRDEINALLTSLRFYKKSSAGAAVPEEFKLAPAKQSSPATGSDIKSDL
ncbi:hypothetical protein NDU88_005733 [Pleurodeles waltl]|uniref:Selenoprotein M n=1 Tax=Pleurodeles waltl TaxID=8319 RepID=A0AAV7LUW8_PLEWA|nr:hypothetical protein NDU88_005733 [Pleurodeles waltl]